MADKNEESSAEPSVGPSDAVAVSLALGGASREQADAFLKKQSKLVELQIEDLRREDAIRHWSIRVRHISDLMKLAFELSLAFIVLAIAIGLGTALWAAAHDDSAIIEAFSVPPDMAARGLTGQAVAAQLQDKLVAMQQATDSGRPATSYANNWGTDVKVEIPNTGVSIGEFYRYLASWLGNQTRITGEVYRTSSGIAISVRAGDGGATVTGSEADFDKLTQEAAEAIYEKTQPYRYAVYLIAPSRNANDKAKAIFERLIATGSPLDRIWAHIGLGALYDNLDPGRALAEQRKAMALAPDFSLPYQNLATDEENLGHSEQQLAYGQAALRLLQLHKGNMRAEAERIAEPFGQAKTASILSDFPAAIAYAQQVTALPDYAGIAEAAQALIIQSLAQLHEPAEARAAFEALPATSNTGLLLNNAVTKLLMDYWNGSWVLVTSDGATVERLARSSMAVGLNSPASLDLAFRRGLWPIMSTALAMTGDSKGAHALIDKTRIDCYPCLRARADIDAVEKNWRGADTWFARATAAAPSVPMAYFDWGRVLAAQGALDRAIAKFDIAHQKGPHFADPLELWGEALIAKNRSDLALTKFEEAATYAPKWGRLHLKWGEALYWLGRKDEARAEFATAASLDLTPEEKAQLERMRLAH